MSDSPSSEKKVHTFETKEWQDRAEAWHAVFERMLEHNPAFVRGDLNGRECALRELDRLYKIEMRTLRAEACGQ